MRTRESEGERQGKHGEEVWVGLGGVWERDRARASKEALDEALYGKAMVHREPRSRVPAESVLGTVGRGLAELVALVESIQERGR